MADAGDLKSPVPQGHASSTLAPGTSSNDDIRKPKTEKRKEKRERKASRSLAQSSSAAGRGEARGSATFPVTEDVEELLPGVLGDGVLSELAQGVHRHAHLLQIVAA